ncbi:ATP-binding protein [Variovorax paradoxus]|uniref:histidine kinase n=1 Tax=Variovorax paradoxus TaxID=34073 RepID=A0A6I6HIY4_VARPD|nr:ATP-binding protein [Variovorax paradoxus]QGW82387.1 HAMP domain-containing protein [Variovorax paradoxus]
MNKRSGAPWSLRRRLAAIVFFVCAATLLAAAAAMYRADHLSDKKVLDARLVALAHTALAFAEHEIAEISAEGHDDGVHETGDTLGTHYHYQIWSPSGRLLLQSHKAPSGVPMRPLAERGFGKAIVDGESVRTYSEAAKKGGMVVQIAERVGYRMGAIGTITRYFLSYLAIPLILIFVSAWWFLNRALRSVEGYASQLRERQALDLTELNAVDPPTELRPMVDSINALLDRFRKALSVERDFTVIAAHEMRTPLAGLRAQAQLASTLADSPQELSASLRHLMSGIDQASYLLDQLLDLARIDSLAATGAHTLNLVNLEEVYRDVMADLGPAAAQRELTLRTRFEVRELMAEELGVHLLMRNLIVNAIRFTPVGGRIEIGSARSRQTVVLTVDDSGPGIPASRHAEAFQRFNRLGRVDGHGVGLGLSIVHAVAEAHHAPVRLLESPLGGLRASVRFPAAASGTSAPERSEVVHICLAALRNVDVMGSRRY